MAVSNILYKTAEVSLRIFLYKKSDVLRCRQNRYSPSGETFHSPNICAVTIDLIIVVVHGAYGELRERQGSQSIGCLVGFDPPIPLHSNICILLTILPSARVQECSGAYGERTVYPPAAVSRGSTCTLPRPEGLVFLHFSFLPPDRSGGYGRVE